MGFKQEGKNMKKIVNLFLFVMMVALAMPAAAHKQNLSMAAKFDFVHLLNHGVGGSLAFKVADRVALKIPFGIHSLYPAFDGGIGLGVTYYFTAKALEGGWYAETNLNLHHHDQQVQIIELAHGSHLGLIPGLNLGLQLLGGYGWHWENGMALDLGIGAELVADINFKQFKIAPAATVAVGYAW